MRILIDGDACPNKKEIADLANKYHIEMIVYGDYAHIFDQSLYTIKQTDIGKDHVDMMILNDALENDIIITQDYGLAGLLLTKKVHVIHVNGTLIDKYNIDSLLMSRYVSSKLRTTHRLKRPAKRTKQDEENLLNQIETIIRKDTFHQ